MQIYLIRHTKVDVQAGICYGQLDVNVANTYENERDTVLDNLKGIEFDKIYSSPLKRCKILANAIANNKMAIDFDNRLKELDFGSWEGQKWLDIESTDEAKLWFNDYINLPCPNGEAYVDLLARVKQFIDDLKKENGTVAIVCHAGVIRAFYSIINGILPTDSFNITIDYGAIKEITV